MEKYMKAITFLGTNNYKEVIYEFKNKQAQPTELFPKALCELFELQELLVLVTKAAKEKWFAKLEEQLRSHQIKVTEVLIPDEHSEEDLWIVFEQMTKRLNEGDEVIFDITHSFRTLPLLSFLAANYLQTAKNVKIKGIYYGAFDAGRADKNSGIRVAPVFDLTPFLELSRWTTATDKFISTGNARELGTLLSEIHRRVRLAAQPSAQMPTILQNVGRSIGELSDAMLVNRPQEIAEKAKQVGKIIHDEKATLETAQFAKPFAVLLERIGKEFEPFADFSLASQRELIDWYLKHGQIVQAVALMREWLVSLTCEKCEFNLMERDDRKKAEEILNQLGKQKAPKSQEIVAGEEIAELSKRLQPFADDDFLDIWNKAGDLRNDVMHFGFRKSARPSKSVLEQAKELNEQLGKIEI